MTEDKKTRGQELQESLGYEPESAWLKISEDQKGEVFEFCEGYKDFLNRVKTEREAIELVEKLAQENGFVSLDVVKSENRKLNPGEKIYAVNRDRNIILAVIGNQPMENGLNFIGSHVDAPRIDLKPNPLYEDSGIALFKTHYYGGIKKYQWTTIPLALHGIIVKSNGEKVTINIGEDENDPQFCITDLLPHLAKDQLQKKMFEGVNGEGLNVLVGNMPFNEKKLKDKVKTQILEILNQKYGIIEEDFHRADLEIVPAFKARDIGLDRSMIGAYGQDDRICAYTSTHAILKIENPDRTAVCYLADKEEIGSVGNTGMQSHFLENTIAELCSMTYDNYNDIVLRRTLYNSKFLSADVTAVVDPTYSDVSDKKNSTYLGKGVSVMKYTGAQGKVSSSEASAEFVAEITNIFASNDVAWQNGEMGKVDVGGGATIAMFVASYGMDVLDVGPGLLSMHAPFEISSKVDVYMTYKAYLTFYNKSK